MIGFPNNCLYSRFVEHINSSMHCNPSQLLSIEHFILFYLSFLFYTWKPIISTTICFQLTQRKKTCKFSCSSQLWVLLPSHLLYLESNYFAKPKRPFILFILFIFSMLLCLLPVSIFQKFHSKCEALWKF